jgi:molybdate transport system ATP-binding protein
MLTAEFTFTRRDFTLEAHLSAAFGRIVVLAGENGSGKTSLLRVLAGLDRPTSGQARVGTESLFDRAAGVWTLPESRAIGYVPQSYSLFPHLTVAGNIGFGLRHLSGPERTSRVAHWADRLRVKPLLDRRIATLSGGERQRVALARALVREPRLLLLDEPLAALDPLTRAEVRRELRRVLTGLPCAMVLVSHDPVDALALADDLVVLEHGRVSQAGSLGEVLRAPASAWVARFLGVNLFTGRVLGPAGAGTVRVQVAEATLEVPATEAEAVRVVLHPREVTLAHQSHEGSARNHLRGPVREVAPEPPHGDTVRVSLDTVPPLVAQVTRASAESLGLRPGLEVVATFKATACEVLPA